MPTAEHERLSTDPRGVARWGPYLAERAWGTVREDYSADGDAWDYFPHDHARSRAYRWNEDGLAGICDDRQTLCFAFAFWNGARPDPQGADLRPHRRRGQPRRGRQGVLVVPRLHADPLVDALALPLPAGRVPLRRARRREPAPRPRTSPSTSWSTPASSTTTATGRSPSTTPRPRPTTCASGVTVAQRRARTRRRCTCCRRCGSATRGRGASTTAKPSIIGGEDGALVAEHHDARAHGARAATAHRRHAGLRQRDQRRAAVGLPRRDAVPEGRHQRPRGRTAPPRSTRTRVGTKAALHYALDVARRRDRARSGCGSRPDGAATLGARRSTRVIDDRRGRGRRVLRRADSRRARPPTRPLVAAPGARRAAVGQAVLPLRRRPLARRRPGSAPPPPERRQPAATAHWRHLNNFDVISMPDPWEYPWYAAWDLAFHCVALAHVDPGFAKEQLLLLLPRVVHAPQRPAPRLRVGVRRRQPAGARLGGAAGVRDRRRRRDYDVPRARSSTSCCSTSPGGSTARTPTATTSSRAASSAWTTSARSTARRRCRCAGRLEQSDGTGWMAMYCLNLLEMALRARRARPAYEDLATKFFEHFALHRRGASTTRACGTTRTASSTTCCAWPTARRCRCGSARWSACCRCRGDDARRRRRSTGCPTSPRGFAGSSQHKPQYADAHRAHATSATAARAAAARHRRPGAAARASSPRCSTRTSSCPRTACARCRRRHRERAVHASSSAACELTVDYEPAESTTGLFGGNSNWRGPDLVPGQLPAHRGAARATPLLRRRPHASSTRPARARAAPRRRSPTTSPAGWSSIVPRRTPTAAARCYGAVRAVPDATRRGTT